MVMKAITAREQCIRVIREKDQTEMDIASQTEGHVPSQDFIAEMSQIIQNLRQLSIHVVEQIVLWRDQVRQINVMSTKNSQKIARKRKIQTAIQLAYLLDSGENYLLKMKSDLQDFNKFYSNTFFNFSEKNADPFLVQTSVLPKKSLATGGGLRSLQNRKNAENTKIMLPMNDQLIQKAKACQEMIMYEKVDGENVTQS